MKRKQPLLHALIFCAMICTSGCVYVVVGGIGALGGYIVSPDTVEGIASVDMMEAWDEAVDVVSMMGVIGESEEAGGLIIAKINGARVTINILPSGPSSVKLRVKSRKSFFPKIKVAQDVYIKIMQRFE